ncbi:MAG: excinuclease ABC subunit UvrC [Solirubrobacterales bacterium]
MNGNEAQLEALRERLKAVPLLSGVYLFKDGSGTVIYVGKARILRNRLRSYFAPPERLEPKVRAMMARVQDLDYIVTEGEVEALILESNLIKSYAPHYNILLRDDKSYPYLKITVAEAYPRVLITREKARDASRYFGPYADAGALRETVRLLTTVFPLRSCKSFKRGGRPCLNRDLGRCLAPCTGTVPAAEYQTMIDRIIAFAEGEVESMACEIEREMMAAAENLEFERAAALRDSLTAIRKMTEQQKVASESLVGLDIMASAGSGQERLVIVFRLRKGKLIGKESFRVRLALGQSEPEVLGFFLQQYYADHADIPVEILVSAEPTDREVLEAWLAENAAGKEAARRHKKTVIRVPSRGEKRKLLDMAIENARLLWEEALRGENAHEKILTELALLLELEVVPERIECFDISHLAGEETVASMVVFTQGEKDAKAYRRFKVRTVTNNDVESMAEVIGRRLAAAAAGEKAFLPLPDLLMVDGGLAQANTAARVVAEAGLSLPVIGLAKKREEIYRPLISEPIRLPRTSEVLKLLQRVRDEAHRFAITHSRKRVRKRSLVSLLDHIPGIGESRRNALFASFGSLEGIKSASVEELAAVPGMNRLAAEAVHKFLHHDLPEGGVP